MRVAIPADEKEKPTMDIAHRIELLYAPDTSIAYRSLQELEAVSDQEDTLYPYFDRFFSMLKSEKYVIRVRGFRLLCKQARWDIENKIGQHIDEILLALNDEKPTAVRQAVQYLGYIVPYKAELIDRIKETVLSIDCSRFKDTMRPLIAKDIHRLVQLTESQRR